MHRQFSIHRSLNYPKASHFSIHNITMNALILFLIIITCLKFQNLTTMLNDSDDKKTFESSKDVSSVGTCFLATLDSIWFNFNFDNNEKTCIYKLCLLLRFMMLHTTIYTCANAITQVRHMFNEIIIPLVFNVDLVGWDS